MTPLERMQSTKAQLDDQWNALTDQIGRIQTARALARVEDETRLEQDLARLLAQQDALTRQLEDLEERIRQQQQTELIREAIRLEGNQSYALAQNKWREVAALGPCGYDPAREGQRLADLEARAGRRQRALASLALHRDADLLTEVSRVLGAPDGLPLALEELLDQLVQRQLGADDFAAAWRRLRANAPGGAPVQLDYRALYQRMSRGEIALFLGADMPRQFDDGAPDRHRLARELAAQAQLPPDAATLSAVAEYFQIGRGEGSLLRALQPLLRSPREPGPLHALLGRIGAPLLIVATGHDTLLESAFGRAGKPYAVISTVITPTAELRLGQVLVQLSDRPQPEPPRMSEELSHLRLLDEGYSVIFKLCGTCPDPGGGDDRLRCSFVLSESSHFSFARLIDRVLPSYLGRQLAPRGLWFLGFAPEQWEDRLFASAILESRRSLEPPHVVRGAARPLEDAFWQSRGVVRHEVALPRFVTLLEGAER